MHDVVWELAGLLEEAARGNLDPKGRDFQKVYAFVGRITAFAISEAVEVWKRIQDEEGETPVDLEKVP
jgi:hypothetical protein